MINLTGNWNYRLDPDDLGEENNWATTLSEFTGGFNIPGSHNDHGIGESYQYDGQLSKENVRHLRQKHKYRGKIWFHKTIEIETYSPKMCYHLLLERVMWQSQVWLNGKFVGVRDSLSVEHVYDLTEYINENNKFELVVCIDNRDIKDINETPSAYTDETQSIWNGMIGRCQIIETAYLRKLSIQILPDSLQKKVQISLTYRLRQPLEGGRMEISLFYQNEPLLTRDEVVSHDGSITWDCQLPAIHLWDEFTPELYSLKVSLKRDQETLYSEFRTFGFRHLSSLDSQLLINHHPTFLRGTIDCCIFPLTGYPSMAEDHWQTIMSTIKSYGLNHIRFHSWCPPEAAFAVADKLGLYLQIEGPIWLDDWMPFVLGDRPDHYDFLPKESERIIRQYGHHPSFCFYSCGNEIRGDFQLLSQTIATLKQKNPQILYTLTSNWDRSVDPEDDLFIAQTVDTIPIRGQYDMDQLIKSTKMSFEKGVNRRQIPVISHEIGQYSVYPSIKEIDKYTGNLLPINFQAIKDDLIRKGMLEQADEFTQESGKLALALYKEEIEAALRTEKMGGFQLLGLNDFTGQSTATVGILDAFWETKDLIAAEEFRQFCQGIVPLALLEKRIWDNQEPFYAGVKIANYQEDIDDAEIQWSLDYGEGVLSGQFNTSISLGVNSLTEEIQLDDLSVIKCHSRVTFQVSLYLKSGIRYSNSWVLWVYATNTETSPTFLHATYPDEKVLARVSQGATLLLEPVAAQMEQAKATNYFPVFWSPVHFTSQEGCGFIFQAMHPLFQSFPTKSYLESQWKSVIETSYSLSYQYLENDFTPLIQVIPNFFNHEKRLLLGEFAYGKGKILISTLNLTGETIETKALKHAIYDYLNHSSDSSLYKIETAELLQLCQVKSDRHYQDLALGKKAMSDSELLPHTASNGNDGKKTKWQAVDQLPGHWWEVDLADTYMFNKIDISFLSSGVYYYSISSSLDGKDYEILVNKTVNSGEDKFVSEPVEGCGRFIRISFGDSETGMSVGFHAFNVYLEETI
ncbi:discoidin domain-containing protein [Vagococcus sp. BWB3-3]|uniref:Discoidin domain-containing protein n=1 Tax=Vagococcus allomyrinae TaxID=2794353 RepID=A0A940PDN7_9ENTE|nr:sugar-binding domain-containing protein [Vagococcus allomyrinae]MBP1040898.1 discoidin domain-containing protein [Vagococcus allomyrinae]